ncbi:MAG: aldehyde dehydrogenase family protein, partial [Ilumatobacteraceae bacterium]
MTEHLDRLTAGQPVLFGGDRIARVPAELAARFEPGDRLVVVQETGDLLHVPAAQQGLVHGVVERAVSAFQALADCTDDQITTFFDSFATRLEDDRAFDAIANANADDVAAARSRGRSTTRLALDDRMRAAMIAGLRGWRDTDPTRHRPIERIDHAGWTVEAWRAPLGVVGFVFEGRPNVFADAVGVLRTGNAVVFRIGSDALGTASAIATHALDPALADAGLPPGLVGLIESPERSAGWALFDDRRLALAVARGSGPAVAQLGAVARQAGVPVSLHGTGGAWMVAGATADADRFAAAVTNSLDRKVCNTLNVCCVVESRAPELVPRFLAAVDAAAGRRGVDARVHVETASMPFVDTELLDRRVRIGRVDGERDEPYVTPIDVTDLATEWEWESSPEVTLAVVADVDTAVNLCNRWSPRFVASLGGSDADEHER